MSSSVPGALRSIIGIGAKAVITTAALAAVAILPHPAGQAAPHHPVIAAQSAAVTSSTGLPDNNGWQ